MDITKIFSGNIDAKRVCIFLFDFGAGAEDVGGCTSFSDPRAINILINSTSIHDPEYTLRHEIGHVIYDTDKIHAGTSAQEIEYAAHRRDNLPGVRRKIEAAIQSMHLNLHTLSTTGA